VNAIGWRPECVEKFAFTQERLLGRVRQADLERNVRANELQQTRFDVVVGATDVIDVECIVSTSIAKREYPWRRALQDGSDTLERQLVWSVKFCMRQHLGSPIRALD
jgi:hypothetical protein